MLTEVRAFLNDLEADGYSESTIVLYEWILSEFQNQVSLPLENVTLTDLRGFMLYMRRDYRTRQGKRLSPSSIQNVWKCLRTLFRWAELDTAQDLPMPRVPQVEIEPLSYTDVKSLLQVADKRMMAILLTLLDTGLRAGELCRLKQNQVNLETGKVFVAPYGSGQKTKSRTVYLSQKTLDSIVAYLETRRDNDPHLFVSMKGGPLNRDSIRLAFRRLGNLAGVKVNPHKFRHTFAIQFLRGGGDVFSLRRLLGHSTLTMTERYLSIAMSDLEGAHRRASPVSAWV